MNFKDIIDEERKQPYYKQLESFVNDEYNHKVISPPKNRIFHCFNFKSYDDIKVVIIGQDPYHEVNQANGLAFSVARGVRIPPSLINIYKEAHNDVGIDIPNHGDLSDWAHQGVLLLNTSLTVREHQANSHSNKGWEIFTDNCIKLLNEQDRPIVFILWGRNAISKKQYLNN